MPAFLVASSNRIGPGPGCSAAAKSKARMSVGMNADAAR
jgi:hypothetical protein